MKTANEPLSKPTMILEEAETLIRKVIKEGFWNKTPRPEIDRKVNRIIRKTAKEIGFSVLALVAIRSLKSFYAKQIKTIAVIPPKTIDVVKSINKLSTNPQDKTAIKALSQNGIRVQGSRIMGQPMNKFSEKYIRENVRPVIERLSKEQALDPDDVRRRNTLRNRAEMEVRYQGHKDNIAELKARGVRLVIASVHADCSKRCESFQGRVYSLDNSYGTTPDGRKFVPLEVATDVFYKTKAGKVYKNGLLGFNCRHYIVEYKDGYEFTRPSAREERKEYALTEKQRELERNIRRWKVSVIESENIDPKRFAFSKQKVVYWTDVYKRFCNKNNRAIYPSLIDII